HVVGSYSSLSPGGTGHDCPHDHRLFGYRPLLIRPVPSFGAVTCFPAGGRSRRKTRAHLSHALRPSAKTCEWHGQAACWRAEHSYTVRASTARRRWSALLSYWTANIGFTLGHAVGERARAAKPGAHLGMVLAVARR